MINILRQMLRNEGRVADCYQQTPTPFSSIFRSLKLHGMTNEENVSEIADYILSFSTQLLKEPTVIPGWQDFSILLTSSKQVQVINLVLAQNVTRILFPMYLTIAKLHGIRGTTPVHLDLHISDCCTLENNQSINCIGTDFSLQQCGLTLCVSCVSDSECILHSECC